MMKTISLWAALAAAVWSLATPAWSGPADDSVYAGAFIGFQVGGDVEAEAGGVTQSVDLDPGIAGGAILGYGIPNPLGIAGSLRPEAEISTRKGNVDGSGVTLETLTFFANAWYDFPTSGPFTPYIGGGVGAGNISAAGESSTDLAWQAGGGVHYELGGDVFVGANYRYVNAQATLSSNDFETNGHQITASIGIPLN